MNTLNSRLAIAALVGAAGMAFGQGAMPPVRVVEKGVSPAVRDALPIAIDDKANGADLVSLAGASAAVFDGELVGSQIVTPAGMRVLVTEYTFRVHEWFRGGNDPIVTVRETGGETAPGTGLCTVDSHKLSLGGRYLVYLKPGYADLLFPMQRVLQVMDSGQTVADEKGRIAIGMRGGSLVTRPRSEVTSLSYLGTGAGAEEPVNVGPPTRFSEPLPPQPLQMTLEDHGPMRAEQLFALIREPGHQSPGPGPAGLSSAGQDFVQTSYVIGAHNFACWIPDNNNWNWFNVAEIDWDNLVSYTTSGWILGLRTSGGNPIRNENPVANDGRDQAGTPSDAQMSAGGYGTWAANGSPNGITFIWTGGGHITETDVFVNPVNIGDELQFRKSVVHEMGHSIGFDHEDRYVADMVSGTWRMVPNYFLGAYYLRMDDLLGGRTMLTQANTHGASWNLRSWRDMETLAQAHPSWGNHADIGPNVTTLSTFSANVNDMITLQHVYAANRGNAAFAGAVNFNVYFTTDPNNITGGYNVWSGGWGSFGAQSYSNNFDLAITIPPSIPTGNYYVGWVITAGESQLATDNDYGMVRRDYSGGYALRTIAVTNNIPANDNCGSATVVGVGTYSGSTTGATNDGATNCGNFGAATGDVWYSYTAPCAGTLTLDTCGSNYDTVLSVHSGCPGSAGNTLACNDDDSFCGGSPARQSRLSLTTAGGTTYLIRVSGYNGATGAYNLHVGFAANAPANDECSSATAIGNGSFNGSTLCADADGCSACGSSCGSPDVWYVWTAPGNGTLHADTCGSGYDTVLSVHTGCPGTAANSIGCNDDFCGASGLNSSLEVAVVSGHQYLIRVSGWNGSAGTYTLNTGFAPANDPCSGAITVGNGATPFTTVGANTDGPTEPNCTFGFGDAQINQDVWFRYTATCTGTVTVGLCDANYDSKIAIYQGGCPTNPGTTIACNDDACGSTGLASRVSFTATQGTLYTIRVGGYLTATGSGTMTIACAPSGCYANCDNSTTIPILNVNDFVCFQSQFAAGTTYANCDHSTTPPVLNVNDFICFQAAFAAGCP